MIEIKDMFKYEKTVLLEIRLDCEHVPKCYLDFGDESPIMTIDKFLNIKKDSSSIFKLDVPHFFSKKKVYTVSLRVETDCPQSLSITKMVDIKFRDLAIIKRILDRLKIIRDVVKLGIRLYEYKYYNTRSEAEEKRHDGERIYYKPGFGFYNAPKRGHFLGDN